jgi:membrane associated rhomboid family serine protease
MNTGSKKSFLSYIPGYSNNAVLQLIIVSGVAYALLGISWAVVMLVFDSPANFNNYFLANVALPKLYLFKAHWWTLFTYSWFHFSGGFFELLSNMLWLYCFGSVTQMLIGHKQIIPLFIYSSLIGGVVYLMAQMLPGGLSATPQQVLGPRPALMAMAAAAVTLTPNYKFYLTDRFSVHIMLVAGIFAFLMLLGTGFHAPLILMLAAGAFTGYAYIRLLRAGYRPGEWMYQLTGRVESLVTPNENALRNRSNSRRANILNSKMYEPKSGISQKRIDDILDKINQKGYNSLSAEEKELLMRAGKEE